MGDMTLKHYGVLGMKWGIRRGRVSKAFAKASRKAQKLEDKSIKTQMISAKAAKKARRKFFNDDEKRDYNNDKSIKYALKSAKYKKKATKWEKKMARHFATTKVSDISQDDLAVGRKYVYMLQGNV